MDCSIEKQDSSFPAVFILWPSKERTKKNVPETSLPFRVPDPTNLNGALRCFNPFEICMIGSLLAGTFLWFVSFVQKK